MKRILVLAVTVLTTGALLYGSDSMKVEGKVTKVSGSTLTIAGDGSEQTFEVTSETVVTAKGASHKMKDLEAQGKPSVLAEFVKADQKVTVEYTEEDGKAQAEEIRVH